MVGPDAKGFAMTDGLLLIHAFPLDARMWEPQVTVARPGDPGGGARTSRGSAARPMPAR